MNAFLAFASCTADSNWAVTDNICDYFSWTCYVRSSTYCVFWASTSLIYKFNSEICYSSFCIYSSCSVFVTSNWFLDDANSVFKAWSSSCVFDSSCYKFNFSVLVCSLSFVTSWSCSWAFWCCNTTSSREPWNWDILNSCS